ncbi:MAG: thiamine pyrophosphate-binding protein, partial [Proteobacteria bacterium]|nr:thiamine pyrophosphate-binding protein [Pseudomonadota bacterium]
GIRLIHMRHEQSGVFAADGYARSMRKPGVCFGTAGPGMTNMITGIGQAFVTRSPVLCLAGQHQTVEDMQNPIQEAYGADICRSITKWSARCVDWHLLSFLADKAYRDAMMSPQGPVLLEIPLNVLLEADKVQNQSAFDSDIAFPERESMAAAGNAAAVERVVAMLLSAERPVLVGGEGVHWANADEEWRELVELLNVPAMTRRIARGMLPENHPLAFGGRSRRAVLGRADLAVAVGLRLGYLEGNGNWAKGIDTFVQINENEGEIQRQVPTDLAIVGNPKRVLRQMIDIVKENRETIEDSEWHEFVRKTVKSTDTALREEAMAARTGNPVHPAYLAQEIVGFLDDSATIVFDAFTGTYHLTPRIKAGFSGQILDAGEFAGVGQGVGMGIGAQLARPGKQVFVMMGDGGIGIGGMDIETAIRYRLPVVFLVNNNSTWMAGSFHAHRELLGEENNWDITPGIRYDKIFEGIEYHQEHVETPEDIRPALERAFNSGKTAVVNMVVDPNVYHGMTKVLKVEG